MADVEFTLFVKKRPVDVELHDEGLLGAVLVPTLTLHDAVELVDFVDDRDAIASISELAWLNDPDVPHGTAYGQSVLFISFLLTDYGLSLLVISDKSFVLWVISAFFDVEGERNELEELSIGEFIILLQIVE